VLHPDLAIQRDKNDVLGFIRSKGIEYVMVTPFRGGAEIVRPLLPQCERVELVKDFGYRTILLRIHERPAPGWVNSCTSLRNIEHQIEEEKPFSETGREADASL
jgi:hypothetical protein